MQCTCNFRSVTILRCPFALLKMCSSSSSETQKAIRKRFLVDNINVFVHVCAVGGGSCTHLIGRWLFLERKHCLHVFISSSVSGWERGNSETCVKCFSCKILNRWRNAAALRLTFEHGFFLIFVLFEDHVFVFHVLKLVYDFFRWHETQF